MSLNVIVGLGGDQLILLKGKLRHSKNIKSPFEQKSVGMRPCQAGSHWQWSTHRSAGGYI